MQQTALSPAIRPKTAFSQRISDCLIPAKNKTKSEWIIDQLNVQPYQYILEIGYGSGANLQQVASELKIGFIAGIDASISMYQQAYRRNKPFIRQQLMQLHIGDTRDLSYPSHYFHAIYSDSLELNDERRAWDFWQLSGLLKSGGKMIQVSGPLRNDSEKEQEAVSGFISEGFLDAGLTGIQTETRFIHNRVHVAVTGFKA